MKSLLIDPKAAARQRRPKLHSVPLHVRPEFHYRIDNSWRFARHAVGAEKWVKPFHAQDFDADLVSFTKFFQQPITSLQCDLLWLALTVYFADRFSPRRPCGVFESPHWRRQISVSLPVRHHRIWQRVSKSVEDLLSFLTEDDWSIQFLPGRTAIISEAQDWWESRVRPNSEATALFSGGLDSLAGILDQLRSGDKSWTLVSGQTHSRMAQAQALCFKAIDSEFGGRLHWLPVSYGMRRKLDDSAMEPSQRSRAFVHVVLGCVASLMAEGSELSLFENGIGAFNLPMDRTQIGSQTSRGTHPTFLNKTAKVIREVFQVPFKISNPYMLQTKGAMCSSNGVQEHHEFTSLTFSCDRFPNYTRKEMQCGICSSCLLRRASIAAANIQEDSAIYSCDILAQDRLPRNADEMAYFRMSMQALNLDHALNAASPWNALCEQYPSLRRSVTDAALQAHSDSEAVSAAIVELYRQHVQEWRAFTARRKAPQQSITRSA